jgi:hypothetical protein
MNNCPRCVKAERERDDALALVNTLQAWRADAERFKAELDASKQREAKLREALDDLYQTATLTDDYIYGKSAFSELSGAIDRARELLLQPDAKP